MTMTCAVRWPSSLCWRAVGRAGAAHEIGKTQAIATFRADGTYQIDVVVDPDALLTKLRGRRRPAGCRVGRRPRGARSAGSQALGRRVSRRRHACSSTASRVTPGVRIPPVVGVQRSRAGAIGRAADRHDPAGSRDVRRSRYGLALGIVRAQRRESATSPVQTFWLEGPRRAPPVSLSAPPPPLTRAEIAWQYFTLGFTHILPKGLDHILFVLGIFLLSTRWRSVLLQVSTFTIAHSITLGLTMYGVVSLPARVVEPMIALSIAYVAIENLVTSELKPWRLALVFSFGLLHGMGFAGVLRDSGLPRPQFLTALVTFNVGVEAGQLTVIAIAFATVAYWRRNRAVLSPLRRPAGIAGDRARSACTGRSSARSSDISCRRLHFQQRLDSASGARTKVSAPDDFAAGPRLQVP